LRAVRESAVRARHGVLRQQQTVEQTAVQRETFLQPVRTMGRKGRSHMAETFVVMLFGAGIGVLVAVVFLGVMIAADRIWYGLSRF
jgi:hypothetical protein